MLAMPTVEEVRATLERVVDPEIPVLTIEDLGILRDVRVDEDGAIEVVITPTYSGCPAMQQIESDVEAALTEDGFGQVRVTTVLSPAWTTDWMTERGRRRLAEYGIAPPSGSAPRGPVQVSLSMRPPTPDVHCPQCGAIGRESSRFGSTSCKAAYVCTQCAEPFDYFKPI